MGRRPKAPPDPNALSRGTPDCVYFLKVWILSSDPPIWRRLKVPGAITLERLQPALQIAFGWEQGYHLHQFEVPTGEFTNFRKLAAFNTCSRFLPTPMMEDFFGEPGMRHESEGVLWEIAPTPGFEFVYTYDLGDNWVHVVSIEKILPPDTVSPGADTARRIECLGGELRGPIEDSGGISGYYEMLDAMADPDHDRHDEIVEWLGKSVVKRFDPERFDQAGTDKALLKLEKSLYKSPRRRAG